MVRWFDVHYIFMIFTPKICCLQWHLSVSLSTGKTLGGPSVTTHQPVQTCSLETHSPPYPLLYGEARSQSPYQYKDSEYLADQFLVLWSKLCRKPEEKTVNIISERHSKIFHLICFLFALNKTRLWQLEFKGKEIRLTWTQEQCVSSVSLAWETSNQTVLIDQ